MEYTCSNGVVIKDLDSETFYKLFMEVNFDGYQIPAETVRDDLAFSKLYGCWIAPCVSYMCTLERDPEEEKDRWKDPAGEKNRCNKLFYESADEAEGKEFLKEYIQALTEPGFPNIGDEHSAYKICGEIDKKMAGEPAWMRLRVKAVCVLTNAAPETLFTQGQGWPDVISEPRDDFFPIANGMAFVIDPSQKVSTLIPGTLHNESDRARVIEIKYYSKDCPKECTYYSVKFPPYGILRVLFADRDHKRPLVSVKGNISCAGCDRAIVQYGGEKGVELAVLDKRRSEKVPFPGIDFYLDAAAEDMGGAVILGSRDFYSTINRELYMEGGVTPLPIRCFRSGNQWARLYQDGQLETNLEEAPAEVTAVVEDADRGLLICAGGKTYDYRGDGLAKDISEEEFCRVMMERFSDAILCETVSTRKTRFTVSEKTIKAGMK